MLQSEAYTHQQWVIAVNLSALLGWLGYVCFFCTRFDTGFLMMVALFGLPIAFVTSWLIGAPILRRAMKNSISWRGAALGGGAAAGIMIGFSIVIGRLLGWMQSLDDSHFSQIGGGDYVQSIDGILTPYGWTLLAISSVQFIAMGVLVGLALRALIGPGKPRTSV